MNKPGRPRVYPVGSTAKERVAASTALLVQAGGARKTFRLRAPAAVALRQLMAAPGAPANETLLVEHLLVKAAAALKKQPRK